MHIADMAMGILGANGIAGGGLPIAVGAAFSAKYRNSGQIVACFFGDGSSNNGTFHESLNFASLHKLPVIFVCENNLYGISVSQRMHQPIQDIAIRATSYDMPGVVVDGNDAVAVYEASLKAVKRARAGEGPTLIECKTYRWRGHHEGDPNLGARYRDREEIEQWKKRCPIKRLEGRLLEERWLSRRKMEEIQKAIAQELDEAVSFAQQSPYPAPGDIFTDVYVAG
jgi:pyruvate dehydrogenase E1 component alpha subunit